MRILNLNHIINTTVEIILQLIPIRKYIKFEINSTNVKIIVY